VEAGRLARHLIAVPASARRAFPDTSLSSIERAIRESETLHGGQIRFAVEAALDPAALWRGETARERALEVFSELRVWDTERNNGVLLYLLLADRDVEILADRGFNGRAGHEEWERICAAMEASLREGRYEAAVTEAIRSIAQVIARHFPAMDGTGNELPDRPAVL
jgi:uncharacterized membrane protein